MPITEFLEKNAIQFPYEIALVEINPESRETKRYNWSEFQLVEPDTKMPYRRTLTWRDFDLKANRFANLLLSNGIQKGDKVAILLMNCLEWLPIYFGTLKAGAVAVPFNYRYTADEIQYCLDLADASILIFGDEFVDRIDDILLKIPQVKQLYYVGDNCPAFAHSYDQFIGFCSTEKPPVLLTEEDDAAIYFSSGTTGFPKAILHNHLSLTHAAKTEQTHHSQQHQDCFLCIPPLYHTGAKMHWLGSLISGSRGILLRGVSPRWILETISSEQATIVWLLVPWAQDILDAIERGDLNIGDYKLDQWRLMHIGAQPVPPSLIQRWMKYFPHHQYDTNYGLSESIGPGCVHLGVENIHKVGAIGKAGYGWKTQVVDILGNPVDDGSVGELCVSGPGVMTCYYKNREATAAVVQGEWLYTGDMARIDEDGFIYLVDRKKDVIISGGENIYPVQIEDFLRTHPCIKDVAVIGRPHKRLGECVAAVIELKEGAQATEEDIANFCARLPRYKRPKEIIFDEIPRNPTGKIEKPRLRKKYGSMSIVALQAEDAVGLSKEAEVSE